MFNSKGSLNFCQASPTLSLAETSTRGSVEEFSEGVQALITCTPQLSNFSPIQPTLALYIGAFPNKFKLRRSIMIGMVEGHLFSFCYAGFEIDDKFKRDVIAAVRPIFKQKFQELKNQNEEQPASSKALVPYTPINKG